MDELMMVGFKLNSFWKHSGRKKALVTILGVSKASEYYMNKDSIHGKNEHLYS